MPRVWRFGAEVNTDQIVPGRFAPYMTSEADLRKYPFIEARPEFARTVQPGDVIVAGRNFGCGSSREYAPQALKLVGVAAIIAPDSPGSFTATPSTWLCLSSRWTCPTCRTVRRSGWTST